MLKVPLATHALNPFVQNGALTKNMIFFLFEEKLSHNLRLLFVEKGLIRFCSDQHDLEMIL